jgi:uncharacterized protein
MDITLESGTALNVVRAYSADLLRIGPTEVRASCLVTAERLITPWAAARFEALTLEHLAEIFALEPQVVLLGAGWRPRFAPAQIRAAFAQRGIGLEVMQLGAACRTFNVLVHEGRQVAAALFFE